MLILWFFAGALIFFLLQRVLYRKYWNRKLTLHLKFAQNTLCAGEAAEITEFTENRKLLPLPVYEYRYSVTRNFDRKPDSHSKNVVCRLSVPGRRAVRNITRLENMERGVYSIDRIAYNAQDLFYSGSEDAYANSYSLLTVTPARLPAERISLPYKTLLGAVLTKRRLQEDPFEFRGIRPYQIYDSIKLINWKASAKTGDLMVNQFSYTTDESVFLLLDMDSGTEAQREQVISLAASLAERFLNRGIFVALAANSRSCLSARPVRIDFGSGSDHLARIDRTLAQIKTEATVPFSFPEQLNRLRHREYAGVFAVISAGGSEEISAAFSALCRRGEGFYLSLGGGSVPGGSFTVLPVTPETGGDGQ